MNCGEQHSASYKGCVKRKEAILINEIQNKQKVARQTAVNMAKTHNQNTQIQNVLTKVNELKQQTTNLISTTKPKITERSTPSTISKSTKQENNGEPKTLIEAKNITFFVTSLLIHVVSNNLDKEELIEFICKKAERHLNLPITKDEVLQETK